MKNRKRMIAKSKDGGVSGKVRLVPPENHAAMAQVEAVEKTKGQMSDVGGSG